MTDSDEKIQSFALAYIVKIEREAGVAMDEDLRRIVTNAYAAAYVQGSADTLKDCIAKTENVLPRVVELLK